MILSDHSIKECVAAGRIVITPYRVRNGKKQKRNTRRLYEETSKTRSLYDVP